MDSHLKNKQPGFIITCEHGGNKVPTEYRHLFSGYGHLLKSHKGFDPGTLEFARELASFLSAPLFFSETTRLLVDLNRSLGHPSLFSEITKNLSRKERASILARHYHPYRDAVKKKVEKILKKRQMIIHIAIHSFTPVLNGKKRNADIGLLYDPKRDHETSFCKNLQKKIKDLAPDFEVRRNYPYCGRADSLSVFLRKIFSGHNYIGIEIEINQKYPLKDIEGWKKFKKILIEMLSLSLPNLLK